MRTSCVLKGQPQFSLLFSQVHCFTRSWSFTAADSLWCACTRDSGTKFPLRCVIKVRVIISKHYPPSNNSCFTFSGDMYHFLETINLYKRPETIKQLEISEIIAGSFLSVFSFCACLRQTASRKTQCGTKHCGVLLQVVSLYRNKQQHLWSCDTLLIYLYGWLVIIDGSHTGSPAEILITVTTLLLTLFLLIHGFCLCGRFLCKCTCVWPWL